MDLHSLKQNNPHIAELDHAFSTELKRLLTDHKHDFDLNVKIKKATVEASISEQVIIQILERQGYSDIKSHDVSEAMKEVLADNYNKILEKYNEIAK